MHNNKIHPVLGNMPDPVDLNRTEVVERVVKPSALDKQEGGGHYKGFKIQPIEFTMSNQLDFIQGNIIKYACRHKKKNGVEDLKKVIHYAELAIQLQYGGQDD